MSDSEASTAVDRLNAALTGRYRIERKLGEGGMATVYLADDIKHARKVALKVLKPELAAVVGAERFLAEIKTTANLQHPNILALHDSGEAEGFLYYIMPYIQGETLRDRLEREKQLPVDEAVRIASEVAEALQVAHEEGVIHRDIKPANILLSKGRPLVADFGIALAVTTAGAGRLTETGLSMGTPFYMSPEQASADREPSAASDVYSLGCVLYEMLVGDPPHTASSAQAVLAKILTGDVPAPGEARATIPAHVDAAIRKSLEKLPADRFTAAQDFARALHDPGFTHGRPGLAHGREMAGVGVAPPSGWNRLSIATTSLSVVLAVVLVWVLASPGSEALPVLHSTITLPEGETLAFADYAPSAAGRPSLALSQSGTRLAYVAARDDVSRLFVMDLTDGSAAVELPGTEGVFYPFFSPDGEWLGFFTRTELKRISVRGGSPLTLGAATYAVGADWPDESTIVFADSEGKRLTRISAETGEVESRLDIAGPLLWAPEVLPDGETLLVTNISGGPFPSILTVSLTTGERRVVIPRGSGARYVESGHLVYAGERGIMAAPSMFAQRPSRERRCWCWKG